MERDEKGHISTAAIADATLLSGLLICGCCVGQRQCRDETPIRAPVGEPRRFAATSARFPGGDRTPHPLCHQPELERPDARSSQVYWRLYNRLVAEADNQHPEAAGKLTAVERRIAGITRAIEDASTCRRLRPVLLSWKPRRRA